MNLRPRARHDLAFQTSREGEDHTFILHILGPTLTQSHESLAPGSVPTFHRSSALRYRWRRSLSLLLPT
jgi:hypothetical protein